MIVAASAKTFAYLLALEPILYVESVSGSIFLEEVIDDRRLPVRFPITLPVTVSIEAASA